MSAALAGLAAAVALALATWVVSLKLRDVSIIDGVWPLMILAAGLAYAAASPEAPRTPLALALLVAWALRLSGYLTWRHWGEPEDHRYVEIRRRNQPGFALKSLYLVFGLQAVLAWLVSWPVLAALTGPRPLGWLDGVGALLWAIGFAWAAIADRQMARFRARAGSASGVLDSGLWRYSRHPNYFGEWLVWWGFFLIGLAAGGWWAVLSPLLMTALLLRVSGVALMERTIGQRRPAYDAYVHRTNAFFPGPPRG